MTGSTKKLMLKSKEDVIYNDLLACANYKNGIESAKNILEVPFSTNLVNKLILQGDILTKENKFIEAKQKYNQALEKTGNESQKKMINLKISTLTK